MNPNLEYVCSKDRCRLEKYLSVDRRKEKRLEAPKYSNAIVLPIIEKDDPFRRLGGVVDNNGFFVPSSAWRSREDGYYSYGDSVWDYIEKAIFIGNFISTWGHMLTDSMRKIWFLYTDEAKKLIEDGYKVIFVGFSNSPAPEYVRDLFNLAGVDFNSWLHITTITKCRQLVVPDNSIFPAEKSGLFFTDEYCQVIHRIREAVPLKELKGEKRLYLAREGCKNRNNDYGEKHLIELFRKNKFEVISPDNYSVKDQIGMLKACKCLASTEGSISHNAIFCEQGVKCIILRKCNAVYEYSALINQASQVDVTFIDAHHSNHMAHFGQFWNGPFYLCITKYLEKFFKQKIPHRYRWLDRNWYRYIANHPFAPERDLIIKIYRFLRKRILRHYGF